MPPSEPRARLQALGANRIVPGLERIRALLGELGEPHTAYPTAIVAGTNGKGSVVAMLETIARYAGLRVGAYTSPHLVRLEERFRVDGFSISPEGLDLHLQRVLDASDALRARGLLEQAPSYFEVLTAVAFRYFAEARVDLAVLEVGLGGRWDATNVTTPRVAVLTSVSLEHREWLGDDVVTIAAEKFEVVPRAGVAVIGAGQQEVLDRVRRLAGERTVSLLCARDYPLVARGHDRRMRYRFDLTGRLRSYAGLELSLAGAHQMDNARCAVLAAEALDRRRMRIPADAIWAGLRRARLLGRCEWLDGPVPVLLDAAHNPGAARVLAATLARARQAGIYRRVFLVVGALADKDLAGIAAPLYEIATGVVATRPPSPRAAPAQALLSAAPAPPLQAVVQEPELALAQAMAWAGPDDLVCVTGSIYLVGSVRPLLAPADF